MQKFTFWSAGGFFESDYVMAGSANGRIAYYRYSDQKPSHRQGEEVIDAMNVQRWPWHGNLEIQDPSYSSDEPKHWFPLLNETRDEARDSTGVFGSIHRVDIPYWLILLSFLVPSAAIHLALLRWSRRSREKHMAKLQAAAQNGSEGLESIAGP